MPDPPWKHRVGIEQVLNTWRADDRVQRAFTANHLFPGQAGRYAPMPDDLLPSLRQALQQRGIERLYQHQAEAIAHVRAGRHLVIATPTASGKSLCFHLPVLDGLARDPEATAMYLYPTKALSRDQEHDVRALIGEAHLPIGAVVYDGDTPGDARRAARQQARLIMTNPDMLHAGILPQHAHWARTFQKLRYVVVDELHTYRGVFGSHVAHVLGRLRRIARFHGAEPVFISATATIANPAEHAARIIGVPPQQVTAVRHSSAPRGERRVVIYNPPVVNAQLSIRRSYIKSAVQLTADLITARVPTIVFGQSRNNVEIMLKYLRDRFAKEPSMKHSIVAYRGGYLPDQRRRVERGLRAGEILCVVATSALELGIDIGDLDAVVCAGYPGSLAETWQRFGRGGRRGEGSLAVLVASSAPLNQFVAQHPQLLLEGAVEQARIDPTNTEILVQHLKCAAYELPFRHGEQYVPLSADDTDAALSFLADHGVVHRTKRRFCWSDDAFPANNVSLRSVGWDNFVIIDQDTDNALAELDWHSAPSMLHEQAIYQHDGAQYQVERLDYDNHKAYVRRVKPDYFTTAMRRTNVTVLDESIEAPLTQSSLQTSSSNPTQQFVIDPCDEAAAAARCAPPAASQAPATAAAASWAAGAIGVAHIGHGEVSVTEKVVGYKKVKFHTHENAGYGEVRLPEIDMHTTSFWFTVPAAVCQKLGRAQAIEGLRGIANALQLVATLALMCDPHDIRRAIGDAVPGAQHHHGDDEGDNSAAHLETFSATAFLYDAVPGGVGLAERIYERAPALCAQAIALVEGCHCELGCPSCVGATAVATEGTIAAGAKPDLRRKYEAQRLCRSLGLASPANMWLNNVRAQA